MCVGSWKVCVRLCVCVCVRVAVAPLDGRCVYLGGVALKGPAPGAGGTERLLQATTAAEWRLRAAESQWRKEAFREGQAQLRVLVGLGLGSGGPL